MLRERFVEVSKNELNIRPVWDSVFGRFSEPFRIPNKGPKINKAMLTKSSLSAFGSIIYISEVASGRTKTARTSTKKRCKMPSKLKMGFDS